MFDFGIYESINPEKATNVTIVITNLTIPTIVIAIFPLSFSSILMHSM